jgi:hypothetical protein
MKIHSTALAAASLLWALTNEMVAQEQAVLGQGNISCGSWLENRKGGDAQGTTRIAWILGYVTAYNQYGSKPQGDVSGGKSTEEIAAWIDDHCMRHPTDNVYRASAALIDELKRQSGR